MYGYQTSWFGPDDPHLDPEFGIGRGFDYLNIFDTELAVGRSTVLQTMERNKNKKFPGKILGASLRQELKELHLYEDTMIVICSNHGEEFGEHGKVGHGKSLHDEVTRVPLLIKAPGPGKELQIEQMSQTVDIMPTILSLLGIPYPHQVQGVDFSPLIKKKGNFTPREYVYGQMPYFKSIQNSEWKRHIFRGYHSFSWLSENVEVFLFGKKQFFNMLKDPGETKDLYSKEPKMRDRLETLLSDWELNLPRYQDTTYSFQPHLDEKTKEKIKKTGYW